MIKFKHYILIFILSITITACGSSNHEKYNKETFKNEEKQKSIQISENTDIKQTYTTHNISLIENKYIQFIKNKNPLIKEMDTLFYHEVDADEDGNKEIIVAFGHKAKDKYDIDLIQSSFVLRDTKKEIKLLKQDFLDERGYSPTNMKVIQFNGATQYYIFVGLSNGENMNGLSIYEIIENDVVCVASEQSPDGVCNAYLTDNNNDGLYEGFISELSGYGVLYYGVSTFYEFKNGGFTKQNSKIDVKEYPKTPSEIILQYISLECLNQQYFSADILERNNEIYDTQLGLDIKAEDWQYAIYKYQSNSNISDAPNLTLTETKTEKTAKIIVNLEDIENKQSRTILFALILEEGKWHISSAQQSINIKSNEKNLKYLNLDINKKYSDVGGYVELILKLPKLEGNYKAISKINNFFVDKEKFFYDEMYFIEEIKEPKDSRKMLQGIKSNHFRSANYKFESQLGNLISVSAELNGGAGGVSWDGLEGNTFDLDTGEKLKLSDIFSVTEDKYLDVIYDFVYREITQNNEADKKLPYNRRYFFENSNAESIKKSIKSFDTENFYLNKNALVVFYKKYELAPGSYGPQLFEIPYDVIADILAIDIK